MNVDDIGSRPKLSQAREGMTVALWFEEADGVGRHITNATHPTDYLERIAC